MFPARLTGQYQFVTRCNSPVTRHRETFYRTVIASLCLVRFSDVQKTPRLSIFVREGVIGCDALFTPRCGVSRLAPWYQLLSWPSLCDVASKAFTSCPWAYPASHLSSLGHSGSYPLRCEHVRRPLKPSPQLSIFRFSPFRNFHVQFKNFRWR